MDIKITKLHLLYLAVMVTALSVAMDSGAFDDESFSRQHSQADEGFNNLESEFAEPEPAKASEPKVIIKEKIIIKEKLVPVPASRQVKAVPPSRPSSSEHTLSLRGFLFTLQGCTISDRNIECGLSAVSLKDDKELTLYGSYNNYSSVFDNAGNQYFARLLLFGNSENRSHIRRRLILDVVTHVRLYFDNVSSDTSSIALLELQAYDGKDSFKIKFRNIPLGS